MAQVASRGKEFAPPAAVPFGGVQVFGQHLDVPQALQDEHLEQPAKVQGQLGRDPPERSGLGEVPMHRLQLDQGLERDEFDPGAPAASRGDPLAQPDRFGDGGRSEHRRGCEAPQAVNLGPPISGPGRVVGG